jgi:lysine/ornithine N-monooxygenase
MLDVIAIDDALAVVVEKLMDPPPEMHTASLMEAVRERRPFSLWRSGMLFGTTLNVDHLEDVATQRAIIEANRARL